jgi:oligopeptidase B
MHGCRYEDEGKQLSKWNTFTDFIACAEHLVEEGWTSKGRICAQGASAGGLLMGVIMNKRPRHLGCHSITGWICGCNGDHE